MSYHISTTDRFFNSTTMLYGRFVLGIVLDAVGSHDWANAKVLFWSSDAFWKIYNVVGRQKYSKSSLIWNERTLASKE
jgi:hypothetical protein